MKLSEILSKYLEDHNLSQRQFAKKCGISNGYISILINEKNPSTGKPVIPNITKLKAIANAMGMSLQELMDTAEDFPVEINNPVRFTEQDRIDFDRLEALHQNPQLGMLFDRSRKMSHADVEAMIAIADRILKERDED